MDERIKVILADDHDIILNKISALLDDLPDIEVVATAENGKKAIALTQREHPDVLILDIDMPELNGLQVTSWLKSSRIDVKVVILSVYNQASIVRAAFNLGACGYVLKNRAATDLVKAIQEVYKGERYLSAPLSGYFATN